MNSLLSLSVIMPILAAIIICAVALVFIVVNGKTRQTQCQSINQKSFEELAKELRADNAILKSELAAVKETLSSINNMMKEIQ